jgi:hypothetical protein
MAKAKILLQIDTDPLPNAFDSVIAVDSGIEVLLRYQSVTPQNVASVVHGAIFTRSPDDLRRTAIYIGGSDFAAAELLLEEIRRNFFGPLRVSVMFNAAEANTTAVAAVRAVARHVDLPGAVVLLLGSRNPVGQRIARLLVRENAIVRIGSRSLERAQAVCDSVTSQVAALQLTAHVAATPQEIDAAMEGAQVVIATGQIGVDLVPRDFNEGQKKSPIVVAIDLNTAPPFGVTGIEIGDQGTERAGIACYGSIGLGTTKLRIHKSALQRVFDSNDQILDVEELFELGRGV